MLINRKIKITVLLLTIVTLSVAAIVPVHYKNEYTNLKVLPKDISPKNLKQIMVDEFQDGLGVGCSYCHAQEKGSNHLDYASDEKPEKEIARAMMIMTMDINKKYFEVVNPVIGDSAMVITCKRCHQGTAHPDKQD